MNDIKEQLSKIKPWLLLTTYIFILCLIVINLKYITNIISVIFLLLKPFIYSIGIAYVLNIPMTKIEDIIHNRLKETNIIYKKSRGISIFISLLVTLSILVFLILYITPQIFSSIITLINNIGYFISGLINNVNEIIDFLNFNSEWNGIDISNLEKYFVNTSVNWDKLLGTMTQILSDASFNVVNVSVSLVQHLTTWFIGVLLSLYLLSSKELLIMQCKKVMIAIFDINITKKIYYNLTKINKIFRSFVGGQLVEALIIGLLIYIMMILTNMPYSLLIATIVSVMALVPVFGAMFAMIIGFVLILSVDIWQALLFLVLFQVIQTLENNLIYPKVVGLSVGLPSLWTLLSIIVFGGLYGVFGMLLAVPLTASIYAIIKDIVNERIKNKELI